MEEELLVLERLRSEGVLSSSQLLKCRKAALYKVCVDERLIFVSISCILLRSLVLSHTDKLTQLNGVSRVF